MSETLERNRRYADVLKEVLRLRGEPVAVKLVRKGEAYPEGYREPADQMSHCQVVFAARRGESLMLPLGKQGCMIGASALNMAPTPEKVASGSFHAAMGMHDSEEAAAKMISDRLIVPFETQGEVVCPLGEADFEPDVVTIEDLPERCYWVVPLSTAEEGGRAQFSTSPFQCACEDITAVPVVTGRPNISLGCFGCRRRTDMAPDEMAVGVPYAMIPGFVEHLGRYKDDVMAKAKRDRAGVTKAPADSNKGDFIRR